MTRRYDDPVDVRRGDDAPEQFLWRGRLYVVRDVLGHWVETGAWWRAPSARSVYAGDPAPASGALLSDPASAVAGERFAGSLEGSSTELDGGSVGTLVDDSEREVWRVEASSGRAAGSGVYDLGFNWSACAWTLLRALD